MYEINNVYILVKTSGGATLKVLKSICKLESVKETNGVYGNYDITNTLIIAA